MNNARIEHLMKSWREIRAWRETCEAVQIAASLYGDGPTYASAIERRDAVAHQTLGLILKSFGICDENGETL